MTSDIIQRISDGRTDLVFEWVSGGHSATSTDRSGVALIKWCASYGDIGAIRFLLGNGESLESIGENIGLNEAVFHGHWQLCQFLIEHGANVNHSRPDTGETPLHSALCKANRPAYDLVLKVLLTHGANPNCVTKPDAETDGFMRDCRTKGETPLHRAAAFGTEQAIQLLLDAGAIVNAKDMNGGSPLTWATGTYGPMRFLGSSVTAASRSTPHGNRPTTMEWARVSWVSGSLIRHKMDRPNYITPGGLQRLRDELRFLLTRERPAVTEVVAWAAANGDRSENADYQYGKRRLRQIDGRIRFLTKRIDAAHVVDPESPRSGRAATQVFFGATVRYVNGAGTEQVASVVGADEVDLDRRHISWLSPLAHALMKSGPGDRVVLQAPAGAEDLRILEVRYERIAVQSFREPAGAESASKARSRTRR